MKRVAGIEPASLAWKARGYSRRRFIRFNASNSKPNMKLLVHSAPLWKPEKFPDLRRERNNKIRPITSMSAFFVFLSFKTICFLDDPFIRVGL